MAFNKLNLFHEVWEIKNIKGKDKYMKATIPLTLAAIVSTILIASSPAHAAPSYDSIHTPNHNVSMEIFWMSLKDKGYEFPMVATVNNGVVTLNGPVTSYGQPIPNRSQRSKIDRQIRTLPGVQNVKDDLNTSAPKNGIARG